MTNGLGSVASNGATLTVIGAPANHIAACGGGAVSRPVPGDVQRYRHRQRPGVPVDARRRAIAGATAASYTTPLLDVADSGSSYAVIVYNGAGAAVRHLRC